MKVAHEEKVILCWLGQDLKASVSSRASHGTRVWWDLQVHRAQRAAREYRGSLWMFPFVVALLSLSSDQGIQALSPLRTLCVLTWQVCSLERFRSLQDKLQLLEEAVSMHDGNVITAVSVSCVLSCSVAPENKIKTGLTVGCMSRAWLSF